MKTSTSTLICLMDCRCIISSSLYFDSCQIDENEVEKIFILACQGQLLMEFSGQMEIFLF